MKDKSWQEEFDRTFEDKVVRHTDKHWWGYLEVKRFITALLEKEYEKGLEDQRLNVSLWERIGKKYGYWNYFLDKELEAERLRRRKEKSEVARVNYEFAKWEERKKIIENLEGIKAMDRKMLSIDELINIIKTT